MRRSTWEPVTKGRDCRVPGPQSITPAKASLPVFPIKVLFALARPCPAQYPTMTESMLLRELLSAAEARDATTTAMTPGPQSMSYGKLHCLMLRLAGGLMVLGVRRSDRMGTYLEKRLEMVVASFGAALAGAVFVPLNLLPQG